MKNLILIPFLALVGCADNDNTVTDPGPEPDTLVSLSEEEPNDIPEMSNILETEELTRYEVLGELTYGDEDYLIHLLPSKDGHIIHLTFEVGHVLSYSALVTIQTTTHTGDRQVLWSAAVEGTQEVMIEIPEGSNFFQMVVERPTLYVDTYSWRAEVEVFTEL